MKKKGVSMQADWSTIEFRRLSEIDPGAIIELMNDSRVRAHLPLAKALFDEDLCSEFVAGKERIWSERGWGPWAFVFEGRFIGWGGLQPEGEDVDVGMILHPDCWGAGAHLYRRIIRFAFGELGVASVITLLPPSRTRVGAMRRLGFEEEERIEVAGQPFVRYRLRAPT